MPRSYTNEIRSNAIVDQEESDSDSSSKDSFHSSGNRSKESSTHTSLNHNKMQGNNNSEDKERSSHHDNPGLVLVSTVLNGNNYVTWRRSMILALHAKRRTKYVLQDDLEPAKDATDYENWEHNDSLVFSWILNSLSKDLAETFLFATSARELWKEIAVEYGSSNGPLIFQLKREINSVTQGNLTVVDYFNKIKRLRDELRVLRPISNCECGQTRKIVQQFLDEDQLMHFLSGLNSGYEHVVNQVLLMEPLPNVTKALSMLMCIDKQRSNVADSSSSPVVFANTVNAKFSHQKSSTSSQNRFNSSIKSGNGNKLTVQGDKNKADLYCDYCDRQGHERKACFRLVGYPEWYKGPRRTGPAVSGGNSGSGSTPGGSASSARAYLSQDQHSPLDFAPVIDNSGTQLSLAQQQGIMAMVQQEVNKLMKGNSQASFAGTDDFSAFAAGCTGPDF